MIVVGAGDAVTTVVFTTVVFTTGLMGALAAAAVTTVGFGVVAVVLTAALAHGATRPEIPKAMTMFLRMLTPQDGSRSDLRPRAERSNCLKQVHLLHI